jgi:gliding motility-associated-like protein
LPQGYFSPKNLSKICIMRKLSTLILQVFFFLFLGFQAAFAQLDTEFWFAPPELTQSTRPGTGGPRDRPIQLVVSTLEKPATVTISTPADLTFSPITLNMAANSTQIVNLTPFIDRLESKPANTILKTGLLIRSTQSISAYYEIRSSNNTDIFALKGANANGKLFYTPFQTHWDNAEDLNGNIYEPATYASFDIVSTDDSNFVTITPTKPLVGRPAGVPFTIMLNRGQVFSCRAIDRFGVNRPVGSKIEATKDVAVTMKDDMLQFNPPVPGADVAGDQLIPADFFGNQYVLVKGGLNNNNDRCYILAIENNTIIRVDGNPIPLDTLNEGEQYELQMTNASYFLSSNKRVGVLHISGLEDQVAGATIPTLSCTGTNRIGFTRTNAATFIVNVIAKQTAIGSFTLNGDPNLVPASAFQPILGSNGWMYARINFSTSQIPAGTTLLLQNPGNELFHVGVTNYAAGVGSNYGYFSNFSRLNLGTTRQLCVGDTAILDAGPAKTSYLWNTGATTRTIETTIPGKYWVNTLSGTQCPKTDTVLVRFYQPFFNIGPDDTICIGGSKLINPGGVFTFTWQDGSTQPTFLATQAGVYWAQVADFQGCTTRDSLVIFEYPRPATPIASPGDTVCKGGIVNLSMNSLANATYGWLDPDSNLISGKNIVVNTNLQPAGAYKAFVKVNGCESFFDTSMVGIEFPDSVDLGKDSVLCAASGSIVLKPKNLSPGSTFIWSDNSNGDSLIVTQSGSYFITVTNPYGCVSRDTIETLFQTAPGSVSFSGSTTFCQGQNASFGVVPQPGFDYSWTGPNGFTASGPELNFNNIQTSSSGNYVVTPSLNGCLGVSADTNLVVNVSPQVNLGPDTSGCGPYTKILDPTFFGSNYDYLWSTGSTDSSIVVSQAGTYSVRVSNANCISRDTITLVFGAGPTSVTFSGPRNYCAGQATNFGVVPVSGETYSWSGPGGFTFNGPNPVIAGIQPNQAGVYTVIPSFPGCPGAPFSIIINVNFTPIAGLGPDTSICPGGSIILDPVPNGGEDVFYAWSNGLADSSIVVTQAGTYSVFASTGLCGTRDTIEVGLKPAPGLVTFTGLTQYCPGDTANFGVNPQTNITYNWSGPGGFTANGTNISIPNLNTGTAGTYTVTPILNGCSGTPQAISINLNSFPLISLGSDTTFCPDFSLVLDPSPFGAGFTYLWNNNSTDSSLTITNAGTYIVRVSNGICQSIDSIDVFTTIPPDTLIISGNASICTGQNLNLSVVPQNGITVSWTGPNGFTATGASISISNLQANQAGSYIASTSGNACPGVGDTVLVSISPTPQANLGADQTVCNGTSVLLDPVLNGAGLTYLWSNNSTDSSLSVTSSGQYFVRVSNGNCVSSDTVQVDFQPQANTLVITGDGTLCAGESLNLNVTPQVGITVSWTGPNGFTATGASISISNLQANQAGSYIASTSGNACPGVGDTVLVSISPTPQANLGADQTVCNGTSVLLDPVLNGAGLTYLWSNNSTDSSLSVTSSGQYFVRVSNGNCVSSDTVQVTFSNGPGAVTFTGGPGFCIGSSATFGVTQQVGVTYSWTGPGGFTSSSNSITIPNITAANAGNYVVIPSLGTCIGTPETLAITVGQGPEVNLGKDTSFCGNLPVTLDPGISLPGYSYSWNVGSSDSSITINQSGTYIVNVSYQGCTKADTINLDFKPVPLGVTIEGDPTQCAGDSLILLLQGTQSGVSYSWAGPGGFASQGLSLIIPNIGSLQAGNYSVTPNLNGCAGLTTSISVSISSKPNVALGPDLQSCSGVAFTLDPISLSTGLTFLWSNGSTDTSLVVSQSGQYWVAVSNASGCTARDTINVVFGNANINLVFTGDTVVCPGENVSFGVLTQFEVSNAWTGPNGFSFNGDIINLTGVNVSQSGYYYVQPSILGCLGQRDSVFLKVGTYPVFNLGADTALCGTTPFVLKPLGNLSGLNFLWNNGSDQDSLSVSATGKYWLRLTNADGCATTDSIQLTFNPQPSPIVVLKGSTSVCEGSSATLEVENQVGAIITWQGPNGFFSTGNIVSFNNILGPQAGNYLVTLSLGNCPSQTTDIQINLKPQPILNLQVDSLVCFGQSTLATAVTSPGAILSWSNNLQGNSVLFEVGTHWVSTNLDGCVQSDTFSIRNNGPTASFTTLPDSFATTYEDFQYIDQSVAGASPIVSRNWDLGFSQIRTETNPIYKYLVSGQIDVELIVTDGRGCKDTLQKVIEIRPTAKWFVPNLFTPNGDGENDFFEIPQLGQYPGTSVKITNRWGQEEFFSSNYQNNWDGGNLLEGIYFFYIKRGDGKEFSGYVQLDR